MTFLKKPGLVAIAAVSVIAFAGADTASATVLEIGGATQGQSVTIETSLAAGTSAIIKDKNGTTNDTCTGSNVKFRTEGSFHGATVGGAVSSLTFTGCSHTTDVLALGSLSISWTAGTNGTLSSSGAEITVKSTIFGISDVCKTGAGTTIGTLTGVSSGHATMHINARVACSISGTSTWIGTYTITSSTGLGVEN
jgi:hypothetical protein